MRTPTYMKKRKDRKDKLTQYKGNNEMNCKKITGYYKTKDVAIRK